MSKRMTEKPLRIGFNIVNLSANAFRTLPINLPTIPSIVISRGASKAIGIEVMAVVSELEQPDLEAGQNNVITIELVKGPVPTAQLGIFDQRTIWRRRIRSENLTVTSVGEIGANQEANRYDDLTDHDGNGEIVADNEIHVSIIGSGNAAVKTGNGYLLYHLLELEQQEAVAELIETAL